MECYNLVITLLFEQTPVQNLICLNFWRCISYLDLPSSILRESDSTLDCTLLLQSGHWVLPGNKSGATVGGRYTSRQVKRCTGRKQIGVAAAAAAVVGGVEEVPQGVLDDDGGSCCYRFDDNGCRTLDGVGFLLFQQ